MAVEPNIQEPVDIARQQRTDLAGLFGEQRGETADYLSRLTSFLQGQPTTSALAERIGQELNLPTLRATSQQMQNTLFNLPYTYGSATRGFDVNQNQLDRIIAQKYGELAPSATLAQSNLSAAEQQLGQRLGYELQDRERMMIPFQSEQQFMMERLARETTGYSMAMQNELDAIIAKMNAGITLSEGEKNRANALAIQEMQYNATVEAARIGANAPFAVSDDALGIWSGGQLQTGDWM